MTREEEQVLEANALFYDAFGGRDVEAMEDLWAQTLPVSCIHPGWSLLVGRPAVLASWRSILEGAAAPAIASSREVVHLFGETAVVLCVETLADGQLMATNVFARELGRWRLVHHQAGPIYPERSPDEDDEDEEDDGGEEPPSGLLN